MLVSNCQPAPLHTGIPDAIREKYMGNGKGGVREREREREREGGRELGQRSSKEGALAGIQVKSN